MGFAYGSVVKWVANNKMFLVQLLIIICVALRLLVVDLENIGLRAENSTLTDNLVKTMSALEISRSNERHLTENIERQNKAIASLEEDFKLKQQKATEALAAAEKKQDVAKQENEKLMAIVETGNACADVYNLLKDFGE